ncbi:hypothetical protein C4D60_Mb04t35660 [Musa balbisiana]|uniref:Uncharacterized protein n=1 Tax=Musa balbisiana TaxID=52838 RepID=A0A4S8KH81_MUSBA|nr:hypothetical protein C4D60_Mb04t35660 [Musa balbisiana]
MTFRFPKKKSFRRREEEEFHRDIPEANPKTGNESRRFAEVSFLRSIKTELSNDWEEGKQISILIFVVGVTLTNSAYLTFYYAG